MKKIDVIREQQRQARLDLSYTCKHEHGKFEYGEFTERELCSGEIRIKIKCSDCYANVTLVVAIDTLIQILLNSDITIYQHELLPENWSIKTEDVHP